LPYSRALQARQTCLFARQAAGQILYRHITPSRATSHVAVNARFATPCLGLTVPHFLQRPTDAPSPRMNAALMDDCRARGAGMDSDVRLGIWIAIHA